MNVPGTIYYTLDGSDPTTSSPVYINPININTNTVLEYFAVDLDGNQSPFYRDNYTIDKIAPTAKANIKEGLYKTKQIVSLSMNKNGTIYYTLNGSTPTTTNNKYTGPITINSTTTLKFLALDTAGNKSPVYTQTYSIDTIPPTVSATVPTNNYVYTSLSSPITIKFGEKIVAGVNYSKIYVKNITSGKIVSITKTITGNILTIKDRFNRINKDKYRVYIPAGAVKDLANNNLAKAYTFSFVTGNSVKTYSGHGVSFNYPVNWEVESYPQDGSELLLVNDIYSPSQEAPSFQIDIVPNTAGVSDKESFDSFVSSPNPPGYKIISKSTLTLNGNKAFENTYTINDKNIYNQIMEDQQIYLIKNHKLYILDFIAPYKTFGNEKGTFTTFLNGFKIQ